MSSPARCPRLGSTVAGTAAATSSPASGCGIPDMGGPERAPQAPHVSRPGGAVALRECAVVDPTDSESAGAERERYASNATTWSTVACGRTRWPTVKAAAEGCDECTR